MKALQMERNAEAESESNDNKQTGRQNKAEENEQNQTPTEKARTGEAEAINSLCGCSKEQRQVCCVCLCVFVRLTEWHPASLRNLVTLAHLMKSEQLIMEPALAKHSRRETLLPCIHSPTLAHMLPIVSRSFLQLLILTIFSKKDNYANLSNSMKMNMRVWEEHRRNSTAFPLMKTVKPTEGFSAGTSSESLCSFKN